MLDYIGFELTILLALINGLFLAFLASFLLRTRLKQWFFSLTDEKIASVIAELRDDPSIIVEMLKPALPKLMGEVMKNVQGNEGVPMKDLKIGGFKIPAPLAELGMRLIGSKLLKEGGEAASANPFG